MAQARAKSMNPRSGTVAIKVTLDNRGVLVLNLSGTSRQSYIVKGWFYGKDQVILRLAGPYWDNEPITDAMLTATSYSKHDYKRKR